MKPEYWAVVAALIPAGAAVVLAFRDNPSVRLRLVCALAALAGAGLSAFAGIGISNESSNMIIGGGFCYVVNEGVPNPPFPALLVHDGPYPLYDLQLRVVDIVEPLAPQPIPNGKPYDAGISSEIGNLPPKSSKLLSAFLRAHGDRAAFNLFFAARNGFWIEDLRLRLVGTEWKKAIQVFRSDDPAQRPIFREVDKGYPAESDGNVKW